MVQLDETEYIDDLEPGDYDMVTPKSIDDLREIVTGQGCTTFTWGKKNDHLLVDMQTANMLCTIYDALSEKGRQGFQFALTKSRSTFIKAVDLGWSSVK